MKRSPPTRRGWPAASRATMVKRASSRGVACRSPSPVAVHSAAQLATMVGPAVALLAVCSNAAAVGRGDEGRWRRGLECGLEDRGVDSRGVEPPLRGEEERWARLELGRCGGGEAAVPRGDGGRCGVGSSRVKLTAVGLVPPGADAGLLPHRRGVSSVLALGRRPLASAIGTSYFLAICVRVSRSACCLSKRSDCSTRSGCVLASRGLGDGARGRGEAARLGVRDIQGF